MSIKRGINFGISDEEYFSNTEFMTRSKLLKLGKSINNFNFEEPEKPKSKAFRLGTMLDDYLTNSDIFWDKYCRSFVGDKRTKAGKLAFNEFKEKHGAKEEISDTDYSLIMEMSASLKNNTDTSEYFTGNYEYQVVIAGDLELGGEIVPFMCKTDMWLEHPDYIEVCDLKTTADLLKINKSIYDYNYHLQQYLYSKLIKTVTGKSVKWSFAFVEKIFPYDSIKVDLEPAWMFLADNYINFKIMPRYRVAKAATAPVYPKARTILIPAWIKEDEID